jgi:hypothetical protein
VRSAVLVALLLAGCATTAGQADNRVEVLLEDAVASLAKGDEAAAREKLSAAHEAMGDLESAGFFDPLFRADADKPFRGAPHERVLASSLLALLDARAGRCDLAIPAAHDALREDARWSRDKVADTALPAVIGRRCAEALGRDEEVARFDADLARDPRAAQLARARGYVLVTPDGEERVLGASDGVRLEVWSTAEQRKRTRGRAFDEILGARGTTKSALARTGRTLSEGSDPVWSLVGQGTRVIASQIRPERDPRVVDGLFARVLVVAPEPSEGAPAPGDVRGRSLAR